MPLLFVSLNIVLTGYCLWLLVCLWFDYLLTYFMVCVVFGFLLGLGLVFVLGLGFGTCGCLGFGFDVGVFDVLFADDECTLYTRNFVCLFWLFILMICAVFMYWFVLACFVWGLQLLLLFV